MKIPQDAKCIGGPLNGEKLPLMGLEYHHQYDLNPFKLPWTWKISIYKPGWFEDEICWIFEKEIETDGK